jgi:hypothetical protein
MSYRPKAAFLTHYSRVGNLEILVKDMHSELDEYVRIAHGCADAGAGRLDKLKEKLHEHLVKRVRAHGCALDQQMVDIWLEMDVDLNAKGLAVWLDRKKS